MLRGGTQLHAKMEKQQKAKWQFANSSSSSSNGKIHSWMEKGRDSEKQKREGENEMTFISKLLFYEIKVNNTKQHKSECGGRKLFLAAAHQWVNGVG